MSMCKDKTQQKCIGFQLDVPIANRMIISQVHLMPAHKAGEFVEPYSKVVKALWDTGATNSTITNELAKDLGLPSIGERTISGVGGQFKSKEYLAGLLLPNKTLIHEISLYGFIGSGKFDILLGMDIISLGDFLISTVNGVMHFSFQIPSCGGIYLQNIQKATSIDGHILTLNQQKIRELPKVGRNSQCSCGSGKKSKKCHCKNGAT